MKFSTLALFATAVLASEEFDLKIVSEFKDINGFGISPVREGAGINYFLVTKESGPKFLYHESEKRLVQHGGQVGVEAGFLQVGEAVNPAVATFNHEGILDVGHQLWACKGLDDPAGELKHHYGVAASHEPPNKSCHKINLSKGGKGHEPSHGCNKTTVTDHITVTGYTTYCPEPTTLTVTTCVEHKCGPKHITVEKPKTITITEECVVPGTPGATPPVETHPHTKPSSVAHVSSFEGGAAKQVAGAFAGVAGLIAMMI
uniref:Uncharacterized protein n=1 Tax=Candidozyma auris TaxID=498019 RepID=A0A0L0NPG2_CANAR